MTKTTYLRATKISTTILLSTILIGITFTSANIPTAFADDLCGTTITTATKLTHDQNCTDVTGGITIGANNITLDLNGWSINCTGAGYLGSCQGSGTIGVDQNGFTGMTVKGPGTINGFSVGVLVDATGANVKDLLITGPLSPGIGFNPRPGAQHGVRVVNIVCPVDFETTANIHGNEIENHTEGVSLLSANCVNIHHNVIHDNNSDPVECSAIVMIGSDNNKIHANDLFNNGENLSSDAGLIGYFSDNNKIFRNLVTNNNGAGISLRITSAGNMVDHNQVSGHTLFGGDLSEIIGSGVNSYNANCYTTTNIVPVPALANKCPIPKAGA